ncbi:MAG: J domain-containing protein [Kofleriaceae bacterium]
MSITQRILESAQSQWSKLTSLVIVDEEPLSHVDSAALQAELAARKAAPQRTLPITKLAGAGEAARAARERAASARRAKVLKEREQREARLRAEADDAFRRVKDQARTSGGTGSSSSSGGRPPRPGSAEAQVLEWHKTLDVPLGADLAQIKTAYRQLMRKYHPDMHAGNPQKQKAATELSLRVTAAYNGLVERLDKSR